MKRGKLLICLASGLVLSAISRADNSANPPVNMNALRQSTINRFLEMRKAHQLPGRPNFPQPNNPQPAAVQPANVPASATNDASPNATDSNPYASIVKRNVFGLNPLPPPDAFQANQGPPPPKITLTGITTIFGPPEALFKVAGVKRGDKTEDEFYIFTEGEKEDDVEVLEIDVSNSKVKFDNHGIQQVIALASGTASSGPEPQPTFPGRAGPFGRFGGFRRPGFAPSPSGGFQPGGAYNNSGNNGGFNKNSNVYNPNNNANPINQLSGDDQQALIAAQHAQYAAEGNPIANLFPPTKYDGQAASAAGGPQNPNPNGPQFPYRPGGPGMAAPPAP